MPRQPKHNPQQLFWRDPAMPFVEARMVLDGREVSYARHWHETCSVGIITGGRSSYVNGAHAEVVGDGTLVVMNPGDVHACNPVEGTAWSYLMFYFNADWVGRIQAELRGTQERSFRPYARAAVHAPPLADAGKRLFALLTDADSDRLMREVCVTDFVGLLDGELAPGSAAGTTNTADAGTKVERAARHIDAHFADALRLEDLCVEAGLSASYLIRAFKKRYGVAPHEYQTNRRIQFGKTRLREGLPIAQVALEAGFADQAHFQRVFKRLTAATPGQYQGARAAAEPTSRPGRAR